jgi:pimeloyl-ACP methyl ester carboxylesterase
VPELTRPDGARIHFEVEGDGPAVLLASYWSWSPGVWAEMLSDLAVDHTVVTYHLRGTGDSSRQGPYDMKSDTGDLEALVEAIGRPTVLLATADSANRAAELGARREDIVHSVVAFGAGPFALDSFEGQEGMLSSDSVVGAFLRMLEHNYRGGMRTLLEATNSQMTEEELRGRIDVQADFCERDAAVGRLRAWISDDPREVSRALGDRLWIITSPDVAGPWLPPWEVRREMTAKSLPDARVIEFESDQGPSSNPRESADAIRQISTALRTGAEARK